MTEALVKTITVGCDPQTAFRIFTEEISTWWPLDRNSISAMSGQPAKSLVLEPRVGGAVYEIRADGGREEWGTVTGFEPGALLQLSWQVMVPADQATEVNVRFSAVPEGTLVELTHTGWEAMGADAAARRDSYASGWVHVFETSFANACAETV